MSKLTESYKLEVRFASKLKLVMHTLRSESKVNYDIILNNLLKLKILNTHLGEAV